MKKIVISVLFVLLLAALGAAYLQWREQQRDTVELPPIVTAPPAPSEPAGPRYPIPAPEASPATEAPDASESSSQEPPADTEVPAEPAPQPVPPLNESNVSMTGVFFDLFGAETVRELFNTDEIVRRFVVTIDNLTNRKLPRQHLLVRRVSGPFLVAGEEDDRTISPDNAARYASYVRLAANIDTRKLVAVYVHYYPLFQDAYAELGEPNAYFNDRLVEVIDHLLATPEVEGPIRLVQPHVFYEYADPDLEALSAGQKILLRMGSANAGLVKAKLREIRAALTHELSQELPQQLPQELKTPQ